MDIYEPQEDSFLLKEIVTEHAKGRILDMGTGSGIQALAAAKSPNVRSVLAVDINVKALQKLEEQKKFENLKKFRVLQSNLFENIDEEFDTIIFNAPYLPQDKIGSISIEDPALYGGKNGWEIIERFIQGMGKYLSQRGQVLLLFSSLTNKQKVDEILTKELYTFTLLEEKKLPLFETLYVYKICSNSIRLALISRGVKNIMYHNEGQRGLIFTGDWNEKEFVKSHFADPRIVLVAIKVEHPLSRAQNRIENEVKWLKAVNRKGLGPRLFFSGDGYYVREFIIGISLPEYIKKMGKESTHVRRVLANLLTQAFVLDTLHMNKEEMHRPSTNVLVDDSGKVILLDFERCFESSNPHNVTQFCSFLLHQGYVPKEKMIELSQIYKESHSKVAFDAIFALVDGIY
jgi:HemK-related putative methylase